MIVRNKTMTTKLSWIDFVSGIDDDTPHIVLTQMAEFYGIPHSHITREELIMTLNGFNHPVVKSTMNGSGDSKTLGNFLNRFTTWPGSDSLIKTYKWMKEARTYDPAFPFGIPTPTNYKVYTPIMMYRICKRNGIQTYPDFTLADMKNAISPPESNKDMFNPESSKSAYTTEQLEIFLYDEGWYADECEGRMFDKLKEIYSEKTFTIGFPKKLRSYPHNKVDKFGIEICYDTCYVLGPRDQIAFDDKSRIINVPPKGTEYSLYNEDELLYYFKSCHRNVNPITSEDFSETAVRKLQFLCRGTKLERAIKDNKIELQILKRYASVTLGDNWYNKFEATQAESFQKFLKQLLDLGFLILGLQPHEGYDEKQKSVRYKMIREQMNFPECFYNIRAVETSHEEYSRSESTVKDFLNCLDQDHRSEKYGSFISVTGYFYLMQICKIDIAEPRTPR